MLRLREHAEEAPEHQLEAVLRILRRQVWNGWLFPNNELQLGDKADDQPTVWPYPLRQGRPPLFHFRFALEQNLPDQCLEGLFQRRSRPVALLLTPLTHHQT